MTTPTTTEPSTGVRETGPGAAGAVLPLTAAQTGMWYAQALDPGSQAQNTAECLEIDGPLDPDTFAAALAHITAESDALRIRVQDTPEGPRQRLLPHSTTPLTVLDLSGGEDAEQRAEEWMRADLAVPFDLAAGPPFRHALFRLGTGRWWWYQCIHHLAMDGYGYSLLVRRTAEVYSVLARGEEPPPRAFGTLEDLVAEDTGYRASAAFEEDRAYWARELADRPEVPRLAGRGALPARTFLRSTAVLGPEATARLRGLAAELRAIWPELAVAAQALYLSRATGRDEVVLGLPLMGRTGSAALRVPGMVMNVLPLRLALSPADTLAALVRRVVLGVRTLRRHQRYRYEDIRRDLGLLGESRPLVGPLVNAMPFDYGADFAGTPARARNLSAGPVEDLTVNLYDRADGRGLRIDHDGNPALYTPAELATHQERWLRLLERLTEAAPDTPLAAFGIATEAEHALVTEEFNRTARPVPATTLIGPIEAQAARTPGAPALIHAGQSLTYGQLNARANRLARHLQQLGATPGTLVAVSLPRSVDLVVSLLAVLKAGAAYLPLDPDYPARRLAGMLADADPVCALVDRPERLPDTETPQVVLDTLDEQTLAGHPPVDPPRALTPAHPAYVIYTSGSTGRPKGVVVPHSAIDNRLRWMQHTYQLTPGDRVLQKTPSSFDVSVWEFFWPLREGAALVLAEPGGHRDPAYLARLIREQSITTCHFVPSMLQVFLTEADPGALGRVVRISVASRALARPRAAPAEHPSTPSTRESGRHTESTHQDPLLPPRRSERHDLAGSGLRQVFCSGEALPRQTAEAFARALPGTALHNLYGPTEAAVDVTHHTCEPGAEGLVPIGRPVWNTRLYVLDQALQPCPPGVPGELYLAGRQLADGYLGQPELTAQRFLRDPFGPPGTRMYRTGDLAQWTEDGEVVYLGRTDNQVKLRGQRIELGEIEAALSALDAVDGACAVVRGDAPGGQHLVGYVTGTADPEAARTELARELPEHMVPSAVVVLDAFPLGPSGKLDRGALPAPVFTGGGAGRAPSSPQEACLTGLFGEVLGVERAGPEDAFFDLGGTSLLAVRLVARIREELGAELTIGALFEAPTPAALAGRLTGAAPAAGDAALRELLPLRTGGDRPPLFAFHPAGGLAWCYAGLTARLDRRQPLYGVQAPALSGGPLPPALRAQAAGYVRRIREVRPHGPYRLLGWSVGGILAHTVGVLLQEAGEEVQLLALLDAFPAEQWRARPAPEEGDALTAVLRMAGFERSGERTREDVLATLRRAGSPLAGLGERALAAIVDVVPHHARLMREHRHDRFHGDVLFITAAAPRPEDWLHREAWRPHLTGTLTNLDLDCTHPQLLQDRWLDTVGTALATRLAELDG
ncbi:AMP-binding protein [Streptomyces sp. NPDC058045]|uniref:AMP-binding protein n=1 Tax=Streptomyces sp. NPDC058045 TaxID=3346311 RepID=UPI0036EA26F3